MCIHIIASFRFANSSSFSTVFFSYKNCIVCWSKNLPSLLIPISWCCCLMSLICFDAFFTFLCVLLCSLLSHCCFVTWQSHNNTQKEEAWKLKTKKCMYSDFMQIYSLFSVLLSFDVKFVQLLHWTLCVCAFIFSCMLKFFSSAFVKKFLIQFVWSAGNVRFDFRGNFVTF